MELLWQRIAVVLEETRLKIQSEIRQYPMPIPACDAHFNWLLEERGRLTDAIERTRLAGGDDAAVALALASITACSGDSNYMDALSRRNIGTCLEEVARSVNATSPGARYAA